MIAGGYLDFHFPDSKYVQPLCSWDKNHSSAKGSEDQPRKAARGMEKGEMCPSEGEGQASVCEGGCSWELNWRCLVHQDSLHSWSAAGSGHLPSSLQDSERVQMHWRELGGETCKGAQGGGVKSAGCTGRESWLLRGSFPG